MRIKPFKIFEAKNDRLDSLKQAFFNIEELLGIEEVSYTHNNKDYYTILISYSEREQNFRDAADLFTLKAEVYRLLNRNLKKIEEQIEFSYDRDLTEHGRSTELKLHFVSGDIVDIKEVILIDEYDYHCDTVKLKAFFKQKYNLDVINSSAYEDYTKHGDRYSVIRIEIQQTEDEVEKYHDNIVEDFGNLIEENDDTGYSTGGTLGFVEEMSISSNREGFAVIAIYVNDSLNVN